MACFLHSWIYCLPSSTPTKWKSINRCTFLFTNTQLHVSYIHATKQRFWYQFKIKVRNTFDSFNGISMRMLPQFPNDTQRCWRNTILQSLEHIKNKFEVVKIRTISFQTIFIFPFSWLWIFNCCSRLSRYLRLPFWFCLRTHRERHCAFSKHHSSPII